MNGFFDFFIDNSAFMQPDNLFILFGSFQYAFLADFKLLLCPYHAIIFTTNEFAAYKVAFGRIFMATIKDIAQLAGVSHGTVSNVLNGRGNVSMQKILRVEQAARHLGYRMDERARLLRQSGEHSVGIVLPNLQNVSFTTLYTAISVRLRQAGYRDFLYLTNDIPAQEEAALSELAGRKVSAVVLVSCQSQGSDARQMVRKSGALLLCVIRPGAPADSVICFDAKRIARRIAALLSDRHPEHLSVISGLLMHKNESDLVDALKQELDKSISVQCYQTDSANADIDAFSCISAEPMPDAVITTSSAYAQKLLNACAYRRAKPPLIISLSDTALIESSEPIYHIYLDYKEMALRAFSIMTGVEQPANILIPPKDPPAAFEWSANIARGAHLNVLMIDGPDAKALQKLLPDFTKHSGIEVTLGTLPYADMYQTACMMGNSGLYDVLRLDVAWLSSIAPKLLRPFDISDKTVQAIWKPMLRSVREPFSIVGNQAYAFPFTPNVQLLFYRKDIFDDTKIRRLYYENHREQLDIPENYAQYCDLLHFFNQTFNPFSPLKYGAAIVSNSIDCISGEFLPCFFSAQGKLFDDDGNPCLKSEAGKTALHYYAEMYEHSFRVSGNNSFWSACVDYFTRGDTAMLNMFINHVYGIQNLRKSKIAGQIGFCSIPGKRPLLGGGVLGVTQACKKQEAALDFIRWACSEHISVPFTMLGGISACRSIYDNQDLLELYPWLSLVPDNLKLAVERRVPKHINEHTVETIIGMTVRNMITGICSPDTALDQMQSQLEALCQVR